MRFAELLSWAVSGHPDSQAFMERPKRLTENTETALKRVLSDVFQ
jgi:hypothetical protein